VSGICWPLHCRLGLEVKVPDHSTFSENRHGRFQESDMFRQLFETVLQRCMAEGLVGCEGFAVDSSLVKADALHQRQCDDHDDWGGGRTVRENLEALEEDRAQANASGRRISPTDPAASYTGSTPCSKYLCLLDQLPSRYRSRDHHGCRAEHGQYCAGGGDS